MKGCIVRWKRNGVYVMVEKVYIDGGGMVCVDCRVRNPFTDGERY